MFDGLLTFFDVEIRGFTVMFLRWVVFGLILLPLVSTNAVHSPTSEQKQSAMLSFDLRRKTKHHRQREKNITVITPTPAPETGSEEEEMEFTLRVFIFCSKLGASV